MVALLAVLGAVVLPSVAAMVSGGSVKSAHETLTAAVDEARVRARRANACFVLVLDTSRGEARVMLMPTADRAEGAEAGETLAKLPESVIVGWAPAGEDEEIAPVAESAVMSGSDGASDSAPAMELCLVLPDGSLAPGGTSRHTLRLTGRSGDTLDLVLGRWRGVGEARSERSEPPSPENTATEASPSVRPVVEGPVEPVGGARDEEQDLLDP